VQIELSSPWGPQKFTRVGVTTNKQTVLLEGGRVIVNPQGVQPQQPQAVIVPLSALGQLGQSTNSTPAK
jgi:hypothetical protein